MEQKNFANWLKWILAIVALLGLAMYAFIIPHLGTIVVQQNPSYAHCYWPWLGFLWATAIPCYITLFFAWKVVNNIGLDRSFSDANADLLKRISQVICAGTAFFFAGNIVMLLLNMSHPGVMLLCFAIMFITIAIAVVCAGLSHLVKKAAALQDQSDWTI